MYSEISPYLTAIIIGLLIGIERERAINQDGTKSILGARTLPMIGLLGAIVASVNNVGLQLIISTAVCLVIILNDIGWEKKLNKIQIGSTSSIAALLTFV